MGQEMAPSPHTLCEEYRATPTLETPDSSPDFLRELCIGDKETGDPMLVEQLQKSVDLWVHYGLPNK